VKYIFIQTSRAKIKQLISSFTSKATNKELFIAPRPLPKQWFLFYTAFARVNDSSKNYLALIKIKNHRIISESDFMKEIDDIPYFWKSEKRKGPL